MKQKRICPILLAGMMTLASGIVTGCRDDLDDMMTANRITVTVDDTGFGKKATRGEKVTTISGFGLCSSIYSSGASYTSAGCGSYFFNVGATSGSPLDYFWPTSSYKVSLFAHYPYGNASFTVQGNGSASGAPTYAYTVPSAIASQLDVMTGQEVDIPGGGTSPVRITMKHRCAAICFRLTNKRTSTITLNSISIEGVKYTGTLREDTWTLGAAVNSSSSNPFTLTSGTSVTAGATADITGTNNIFMMLPQDLPATAKVKVVVGEEVFETELTGSWEAGIQYNYNITVDDHIVIDLNSNVKDWVIKEKNEYLTFTALESGTFTLTIGSNVTTSGLQYVSYSTDNGETWIKTDNADNTTVTITTPTVAAGGKVLWKGYGTATSVATHSTAEADRTASSSIFSSSGRFDVSGNVMSLLYNDGFKGVSSLTANKSFALLFYCQNMSQKANVISSQHLYLPAANKDYCFLRFFQGCTTLTDVPELPAKTLGSYCYQCMFYGCTSIVRAPVLPAKTLKTNCYQYMFGNCTSLTDVPFDMLPATSLQNYCYSNMFLNCTSLITSPELPAVTLKSNCYSNMFNGCTSLNYIKAAFTTTPSTSYTNSWVSGVAAKGKFRKNSAAAWNVTGVNGVPSGWTTESYTP